MPDAQTDDLDARGRRAVTEEWALGRLTLASRSRPRMATKANHAAGACLVASLTWWLLADGAYPRWAFGGTWLALAASPWLTKHATKGSEAAFDTYQAARTMPGRRPAKARLTSGNAAFQTCRKPW